MTPTAVLAANPTSGNAPLTVAFDATGSTHPIPGEPLTYSWDLNGDGVYGDSTAAQPSYTYTDQGELHGAPARDRLEGWLRHRLEMINVSNQPPVRRSRPLRRR